MNSSTHNAKNRKSISSLSRPLFCFFLSKRTIFHSVQTEPASLGTTNCSWTPRPLTVPVFVSLLIPLKWKLCTHVKIGPDASVCSLCVVTYRWVLVRWFTFLIVARAAIEVRALFYLTKISNKMVLKQIPCYRGNGLCIYLSKPVLPAPELLPPNSHTRTHTGQRAVLFLPPSPRSRTQTYTCGDT